MHRTPRWSIVLVAAVLGVAGCAATVSGDPQAGSDRGPLSWGPDLTGAQLATVLLDVAQVDEIVGSTEMVAVKRYDAMPNDAGASYSDPGCAGAVFNTVESGYRDSHYVAARGLELSEPDEHFQHYVDQGVVLFGSGKEARTFLATSRGVWGRCVGKHVTYTPLAGRPSTWTIRTPVTAHGITAAVVDREAGDGYTCSHGITAKSNVIVDVSVCGYNIADQGGSIVAALVGAVAGKFPT
ncbi:sensor domain-containing protein [Mycobacterium basiliense]|nr:sensor domain-containing protein [Mycobacterium basiliense]